MEIDPVTAAAPSVASRTVNPTAAPSSSSSKLSQLTESLKLEHQFVRVPFDHYKKAVRFNHRIVEKEVSAVISTVNETDADGVSGDVAVERLSSLVSRSQGLKRKVS